MTTKMRCQPGRTKYIKIKKLRQQITKTQKENQQNKHKMNHMTILRSSDRRGRHLCAHPPIGHAIRRVCEWTHCVWMSGLSAEEPGSSPPTRGPRWGVSPPRWWAGPESSCACAREWTSGVCACLECARRLDVNACREKQNTYNIRVTKPRSANEGKYEKKFCLLKRQIIIPERKNIGNEKTCNHKGFVFNLY